MNRKRLIFIALIGVLGVVGLFFFSQPDDVLKDEYQLKTDDIEVLIDQLETRDFEGALSASITHQTVSIQTEEDAYTFDLLNEMFYISFAPYINMTHECYTHSLTGCQGELVNQDMEIKVYDESNQLIDDRIINTGDDGFIGLFLESGQTYRIDVVYNDLTTEFYTSPTQTCYTEARLS